MPVTYATYSEFTQVYSVKGVSQTEINSVFLPMGAMRVNEALGAYFTTPFTGTNLSAQDLSIKYAFMEIVTRNRAGQINLTNIKEEMTLRITGFTKDNNPMVFDDGTTLFASTTKVDAFSTTQNFNPTFTVLDPRAQQVDHDLQRDEFDKLDRPFSGNGCFYGY